MTRIVACLDLSPSDAQVLRTADTLAGLLGATVDAVNVRRPGVESVVDHPDRTRMLSGDPAGVLLDELQSEDVVLGVIGSRSVRAKPVVAGHVAMELLASSPVPLAVVAPGGASLQADHPRILIPLDGAVATTEAVAPLANALASGGAGVLFLHVFDSGSVPPFVSSADDLAILAEEFLDRHLPERTEPCELRLGEPGQHIGDVADAHDADAIMVAWRQDLSPGRAEVVRHLVRRDLRPLIIVPIPSER